jgi:hypothetical protein
MAGGLVKEAEVKQSSQLKHVCLRASTKASASHKGERCMAACSKGPNEVSTRQLARHSAAAITS